MCDLLIIGEILVEIMREHKDIPLNKTGSFLGPYPSGAPAICADTASRLNCNTLLIGGIGKDDFGKCILTRLKNDGVNCSHILQSPFQSTGCAFVTYHNDGSRKYIFHMGASIDPKVPAPVEFEPVKYMHIMGCSLMVSPQLAENIVKTMKTLSATGTKISFDPNIRKELFNKSGIKKVFNEVLENTNIFLPGKEELLLISGEKNVESAINKCFQNPRLELLVIKNGAAGSHLYTRKGFQNIPAYKIIQKDATGAGDCYDGAFLAGLIHGMSPEESARSGSAAGALNALEFGPMEGKINWENIFQMIYTGNNILK